MSNLESARFQLVFFLRMVNAIKRNEKLTDKQFCLEYPYLKVLRSEFEDNLEFWKIREYQSEITETGNDISDSDYWNYGLTR